MSIGVIELDCVVESTELLFDGETESEELIFDGDVETEIILANGDYYTGDYVFTPTQETQTAFTANKVLLENITINPIPSNYGLITWNGAVLTVS